MTAGTMNYYDMSTKIWRQVVPVRLTRRFDRLVGCGAAAGRCPAAWRRRAGRPPLPRSGRPAGLQDVSTPPLRPDPGH